VPSPPSPPAPSPTCRDRIFAALLQQPLDAPPNTRYVYSDLSMITLMFVVGRVVTRDALIAPADLRADCPTATDAQLWICAFEAFVRTRVVAKVALKQTAFQVGAVSGVDSGLNNHSISLTSTKMGREQDPGLHCALGRRVRYFQSNCEDIVTQPLHLFAAYC
jgi:hypothetical protein